MAEQTPEDFRSVLYSVDRQGRRRWLYVDIVKGAWRRRRQLLAFVLIAFYLAVPFLSVNGQPFLRIDIPSRSYIILGQIFWPQDFAYALLFFLIFLVGTLLMVALCGRVFCGWLCPHNVFLEMVFRPIERLCEGPAHRHRRNDERQTGDKRFLRKSVKIMLYLLVAGALANAGTAVFVGKESFIGGVILDPIAHPYAAIFFAFLYGAVVFNFVWFREQTCTLVCPYGRMQTAMLDRETLVVAYDEERGEPRGKKGQVDGDCIDCKRCIQVCPTGIDIRNGNQLECIHCAACIDACNDIMGRMGRAPNLIKYASEASLAGERQRIIRPRTILYASVLTILVGITALLLVNRDPVQITQLRQRSMPQVTTIDARSWVQSALPLSLVNKTNETQSVHFDTDDSVAVIITQYNPLALDPNQRQESVIYVRYPLDAFTQDQTAVQLQLNVMYNGQVQESLPVRLPRLQATGD